MSRLKFLVSLTTRDNDYQQEQAHCAQLTAGKSGIDLEILYAEGDSITQSTQLLKAIQANPAERPNAIIFEPAGATALPQVARAAIAAGIGWAVLNWEAAYISELRRNDSVPIFRVSPDQTEVGRISGKQCAALLPSGGEVLYIEGPSHSEAARDRGIGMRETKPGNIHMTVLKGQWTEESAKKAVAAWLKLTTSQKATIDLVASQNDVMAVGARKAFQEIPNEQERLRWSSIPLLGCDGVPRTGQAWVRSGLLVATIIIPPTTGQAIEMMAGTLVNKTAPPERAFAPVKSFPEIESLRIRK
jgi:ribose transport system substrate-binding protein